MTDRVLIAGAGPVGLTLALELTRFGVPVRLVDKAAGPAETSRAIAIWSRTLELFERAGVTTSLLHAGNRVFAANVMTGSRTVARLAFDGIASDYPFVLMLPQSETEAVLRQHLRRHGIRPEFSTELVAFRQDDSGVTATLALPDGRTVEERFAWLVGCDGAHSVVRHGLGLDFPGDTMGLDWTQGDFHVTGVPFPASELATYWHADGALVFFPMGVERYRVIASLEPTDQDTATPLSREEFQALIDRRGPGGITLTDTVWTSAFRVNERQVERYRDGRVFLAGDAAHVHSPAGGQGMNTGIQDAVNLAWKLAMVCRRSATAGELLDSFDAERRPVGTGVIQVSGRLTRMATVGDHTLQHVRNFAARILMGLAPVQRSMIERMTEVSIGYPESPLNGPAHLGGLASGCRMPPVSGEVPYGSGNAPRFVLRGDGTGAEWLAAAFPDLIDPLIRPEDADGGIQLVRPDGYLAASAPSGQWNEIFAYVDHLASARSRDVPE